MIVPDTSAWVEWLRATEHPVDLALDRLLREHAEVAVNEVIVMEVLAGARDGEHLRALRTLLLSLPLLRLEGLADYEQAALVYRACRAGGETIRSLVDCLIAVTAMKAGARVMHNDADFDAIARHTNLEVEPLAAS